MEKSAVLKNAAASKPLSTYIHTCIARAQYPTHGANISILIFKGWYSEPNWFSQWPGLPPRWHCILGTYYIGAMLCLLQCITKNGKNSAMKKSIILYTRSNKLKKIEFFLNFFMGLFNPRFNLSNIIWYPQIVHFFSVFITLSCALVEWLVSLGW